jgi:glutathione S-transferase
MGLISDSTPRIADIARIGELWNEGLTRFGGPYLGGAEFSVVDAFYCPGVDGVVNIINDPVCVIYEGGVTPRANWAEFLAANPDADLAALGAQLFAIGAFGQANQGGAPIEESRL